MIVLECTLQSSYYILFSHDHPHPPLSPVSVDVMFTANRRVHTACSSTVTEALDTRFRMVLWLIPIVFHTCVHGPLASLFVVVVLEPYILELLEETCAVHEIDHVAGDLRV